MARYREPFGPLAGPRLPRAGGGLGLFTGDPARSPRPFPDLRIADDIQGPPPIPEPLAEPLHQDLAKLMPVGLAADIQGVGELVSSLLDGPWEAVFGMEGPHRMVDRANDLVFGAARGVVKHVAGFPG